MALKIEVAERGTRINKYKVFLIKEVIYGKKYVINSKP